MSIEDLDKRIAEWKAKNEPLALREEKQSEAKRDAQLSNELRASRVTSLSEIMPNVISGLERVKEKWAAFREEQKPLFAKEPKFIRCAQHPKEKMKILFDETCQQTLHNKKFTPIYAPCSQCLDEATKARRRLFWRKRGVPERVIDATFLNFEGHEDAVQKVRSWLKKKGLFLMMSGTTGTGKGHLAASCLKQHGDGLFIEHVNMLSDLRSSYSTQATAQLIETWQSAEMLVLDELGLSAGGNDEQPMLYQVLADRHDKRRPTIITTNQEREKVRDLLGYRLLDRIREDATEVQMNWESFRTKKGKL